MRIEVCVFYPWGRGPACPRRAGGGGFNSPASAENSAAQQPDCSGRSRRSHQIKPVSERPCPVGDEYLIPCTALPTLFLRVFAPVVECRGHYGPHACPCGQGQAGEHADAAGCRLNAESYQGMSKRRPVLHHTPAFSAATSALSASIWTCCSCTARISGAMNCS